MSSRLAIAGLVLAGLGAAGCRSGDVGTLRAHWSSADTTFGNGELAVPLRATWCESRGRLTLLSVSGDTGVGILIRTVKLAPGLFGVSDTAAARSPGSTLAFRLAEAANLFVLSSDSGAVAITSVRETGLTGRFVAWFSRPGAGPALLTGSFRGASALPDTVRCEQSTPPPAGPPVPQPAPDSSVS